MGKKHASQYANFGWLRIAMQGNKNGVKTPNFLEIRCNCLILNN